jgi:hypothetical protein
MSFLGRSGKSRAGTTLAMLVLAATLAAIPLSASASPTHVDVSGLSSMFQMVVSDDLLFVSAGSGGSVVRMLRHDLSDAGSITGVPGASGMAIHGDVLYVASESASRIDRFDLSTHPPTQLTAWDTSSVGSPRWVAVAGGYMWFTDCVSNGPILGRVNLVTGNAVDRTPDSGPGAWTDCGTLEWSPFAPDLLTVMGDRLSVLRASVFDVSSGIPVFLSEAPTGVTRTIEMLPGATQWASAFDGGLAAFPLGDLETPDDIYEPVEQTNWAWHGLAVTDAGPGMMALIGRNTGYDPDIRVWKIGRTQEWRSFDLSGFLNGYADGIEFTPDGLALFAATGEESGVVRISRMDPWRQPTELLVTSTVDAIDYGKSATLTITLDGGGTERTVSLWADPAGDRPRRIVAEVEVPGSGTAAVTVAPLVKTRYTATFEGGPSWEPTTSPVFLLQVNHLIRGKTLRADRQDGEYDVYRRGSRVFYRAVGEPAHRGDFFWIELERRRSGRWIRLVSAKFAMNRSGVVTVYIDAAALGPGAYRFSSTYDGDALHGGGWSGYSFFKVL